MIFKTNGDIDTKIATYNDDIDDYNDRLDELSARMDTERARYVEQFTAMEASVTNFKKTGDMLDTFMETWKAGLKDNPLPATQLLERIQHRYPRLAPCSLLQGCFIS